MDNTIETTNALTKIYAEPLHSMEIGEFGDARLKKMLQNCSEKLLGIGL